MKKTLATLTASSMIFLSGCFSIVDPPISKYGHDSKTRVTIEYTNALHPFTHYPRKCWTFYYQRNPEDIGIPSKESWDIKLFDSL